MIKITANNVTITLPLISGNPDFSVMPDYFNITPYQEQFDLGEYIIIPDESSEEKLVPEWDKFGYVLLGLPSYNRLAQLGNQSFIIPLVSLVSALAVAGDNTNSYLAINQLWDGLVASVPLEFRLSEEEVIELNVIAEQFHMTFTFNLDGYLLMN